MRAAPKDGQVIFDWPNYFALLRAQVKYNQQDNNTNSSNSGNINLINLISSTISIYNIMNYRNAMLKSLLSFPPPSYFF